MTRAFDTIVMLDWSGAPDRGPRPRPDAIWASVVGPQGEEPPLYLRSPAAAQGWLVARARAEIAAGRRLLVGADFPFGYPQGIAARITGQDAVPALWDWFAEAFDTLPAGQGRFDIAARLNRLLPGDGPFWFNGLRREIPDLPRKKPARDVRLPERRAVEACAPGSFACWQMGGTGAVGSQAMTGMAAIARSRRALGPALGVWPFEPLDAPVALVEIWPSLARRAVAARIGDSDIPATAKGPIKDAAQVSALARVMARAQARGHLDALLKAPPPAARRAEGWILGIGGPVTLDALWAGA